MDALRKLWKEKHDYFNEFSSIDPNHYSNEVDYSNAIENKKNWMNKYDKDNAYKLDPSDYDCEEEYLNDLRVCWQDKYDPNNEHTNIDPCDYSRVEEYHKAIMDD